MKRVVIARVLAGVALAQFASAGIARGGSNTEPVTSRESDGPSRALPIALLSTGVPLLTGGAVLVALDEDEESDGRPEFRDSGTTGLVAIVSGGFLTSIGTILYLRNAPPAPGDHPILKWGGVAGMVASVITGALSVKYDRDQRAAIQEFHEQCKVDCSDHTQFDRSESLATRADWLVGTSTVLGVAGLAAFLVSREGSTHAPAVQVTTSSATVGWSTTF